MVDERTHFKDPTGVWRPRLSPSDLTSITDQLVTVEDLLTYDVETMVSTIIDTVILFPSGVVSGPVHIGLTTIREDPTGSVLTIPVHIPRSDGTELDKELHEFALSIGGRVANVHCNCLGEHREAWETEVNAKAPEGQVDVGYATAEICKKLQVKVDEMAGASGSRAEELRDSAATELRERLRRRAEIVQAVDQTHRDLGIKLIPAPEREQVKLTPKTLGVDGLQARAAAGEPMPTLVEEAREGVIRTITSFASALESMPATAQQLVALHEEQLRDVLLFVLNANWRGTANGEVFTNQGKTDISIFANDLRLFMAELKWWKGPKKLTEAVDQLSKYTVARDTAACLVLLYRDKNFTSMCEAAEDAIEHHPRVMGRISTRAGEPARFKLRSSVDEKRTLELVFIPICLAVAS